VEWVESKGARKRWIKIGDFITKIYFYMLFNQENMGENCGLTNKRGTNMGFKQDM